MGGYFICNLLIINQITIEINSTLQIEIFDIYIGCYQSTISR